MTFTSHMCCTTLRALALCVLMLNSANAENRLALVIGNADYASDPLLNPVNDARAMARKLKSLDFKVTQIINLKRDQMGLTLERFIQSINVGDTVVFFYAGHGIQVNGRNYLLATDAQLQTSYDVGYNSINVGNFLERLDSSRAKVKIIFLDACRNNPFLTKVRGGGQRGLARMGNAPSGTLISFATRPGGVAEDGNNANGVFTEQLLQHIDTPGVPVEQMLKEVASGTLKKSNGKQEPWIEGSIRGNFIFKPLLAKTTRMAEKDSSPNRFEEQAWDITSNVDSRKAYEAFLQEYPDSSYAGIARIKLSLLDGSEERPATVDSVGAVPSQANLDQNALAKPKTKSALYEIEDSTSRWTGSLERTSDGIKFSELRYAGNLFGGSGALDDEFVRDGPFVFTCDSVRQSVEIGQSLDNHQCAVQDLSVNFSGSMDRMKISIRGHQTSYEHDEFYVRLLPVE